MAGKETVNACVLVDRNGIAIYRSDNPAPVSFGLPPQTVDAIDVVDDDGLIALLGQSLAGEHPPAETIIIFLDQTYYTKDVSPDPKDKEKDISPESDEKYTAMVPFETTFSRRYDVGNKAYLTVVNADMFYVLKMGLEKNGYEVVGAVPEILFGDKDRQFTLNSPEGFQQVLKKFEYLKKNSIAVMSGSTEAPAQQMAPSDAEEEIPLMAEQGRSKKSVLPLALPLLTILLAVLGFVMYQQFRAPVTPPSTAPVTAQPAGTAQPTLALSSVPTPTVTGKRRSELTIRVLNGSGRAGDASRVGNALENAGYRNIDIGNADAPNSRATQVTFSGSIPPALRDEFRTAIEEIEGEVDIRESATGAADIIVLTGARSGNPTGNEPSEQDAAE